MGLGLGVASVLPLEGREGGLDGAGTGGSDGGGDDRGGGVEVTVGRREGGVGSRSLPDTTAAQDMMEGMWGASSWGGRGGGWLLHEGRRKQ